MDIVSKVVNVKQGSDEWHTLRASHYGASEVNCVLSRSAWKPKTFQELADIKLGRLDLFQSQAMKDGSYYEARARDLVNEIFYIDFNPMVFVNDDENLPLIASLDGIDFSGECLIEIKTSQKSLFDLENYYFYQVQQQLLLSGAKSGFIVRYDKDSDNITLSRPILPDINAQKLIIKEWGRFHKFFIKYKDGDGVADVL